MSLSLEVVSKMINVGRDYVAKENEASVAAAPFFEGRLGLRNKYCELASPLTHEQTQAIMSALTEASIDVQGEAKGRLKEWDQKRKDGKITITPSALSVEQFSQEFVAFYKTEGKVLDSTEHKAFIDARDVARKVFMDAFKGGASVEEVKAILTTENFDERFIARVTKEWAWKAGL